MNDAEAQISMPDSHLQTTKEVYPFVPDISMPAATKPFFSLPLSSLATVLGPHLARELTDDIRAKGQEGQQGVTVDLPTYDLRLTKT